MRIEYSIHNLIDKIPEENEDALAVVEDENSNIIKYAISDGAGGVGIFCKDWAQFLVNNQPDIQEVSEDNINNWFHGISEAFYNNSQEIILKDVYTKSQFVHEGSFATLIYLWQNVNTRTLHYLGVGDSCLFVFGKTDGDYHPKVIYPINQQKKIDDNPILLNWQFDLPLKLPIHSTPISTNDIIILSTDAIARWIISSLFIIRPEIEIEFFEKSFIDDKNYFELIKLSGQPTNKIEDYINYLISKFQDSPDSFVALKIDERVLIPDDYTILIEKVK